VLDMTNSDSWWRGRAGLDGTVGGGTFRAPFSEQAPARE